MKSALVDISIFYYLVYYSVYRNLFESIIILFNIIIFQIVLI